MSQLLWWCQHDCAKESRMLEWLGIQISEREVWRRGIMGRVNLFGTQLIQQFSWMKIKWDNKSEQERETAEERRWSVSTTTQSKGLSLGHHSAKSRMMGIWSFPWSGMKDCFTWFWPKTKSSKQVFHRTLLFFFFFSYWCLNKWWSFARYEV